VKARLAKVPVVGGVLRMLDRYRLDAADQFAAAIGTFIFLALVPVLLLVIAAAGFILTDPADQIRVTEELARSIPGLGATLGGEDGTAGFVEGVVENRGALTGFGIIGVLLTAFRPINAAMTATVTVFRAPLPQGAGARGRQLLALLGLGAVAFAAAGTSTVVGFADLPTVLRLLVSVGATFALDVLLFWTAYTVLSPASRVRGPDLLPGALLGGVGWTALKVAGSAYVSNQVEEANALYGALGGVVALLLLLYLGARLYLYGAELNAVRYEKAHGPIPVAAGATSLARVDDPLPDGTYVTAPGGPPPRRRAAHVAAPAAATGLAHVGEGGTGTDVRKVAGYAVAVVGVAAAYKVLRQLDPP
jgi:membrane protein